MEKADAQYAQAKLAQLKGQYQVDVLVDWGDGDREWQPGKWTKAELERLHNSITLLANVMGESANFIRNLGGVTVKKADIGTHGGEAITHRVSFSTKASFSAWTVVHEFAHAWDANYGWKLSRLLEQYTGGYTSPILSYLKQLAGLSDSAFLSPETKPGRYGIGALIVLRILPSRWRCMWVGKGTMSYPNMPTTGLCAIN
jgi:hypothetical protein